MPNLVPTALANDYLASKAKDAIRMEEKGMSPGLIFDASSIVRTPGGYLDLVTGDITSLDEYGALNYMLGKGKEPKLASFVDYPELYRAAPELKNTTIGINKNLEDAGAWAAYEHGYDNIATLKFPTNTHSASLLPHELQHALDYKSSNNAAMMKAYIESMQQPSSETERRAWLVETADRLRDPKLSKQAIYDVISNGLPPTPTASEDAILKAAAFRTLLNAGGGTKRSKR